jgi:hypothetical protein
MTATVALYELVAMRDVLDEFLAETEGEVTPELEQLLVELQGQTEEKVERVALYIREQLATADAVKAEEQRLAARRKSLERAAEGLKGYLARQLELLGRDKIAGTLVTLALQKNPPSLRGEVTPDTLAVLRELAPELVRVVPETVSLDRKAILDAWKTTGELPDGLTVEQGRSLRIR